MYTYELYHNEPMLKDYTKEHILNLKSKHSTWVKVAEALEVSEQTLRNHRKRLKMKMFPEIQKCNEKYFEKIDNPQKAYHLGFIGADGYILDRSICQNIFGISLKDVDIKYLERLRKDINGKTKINKKAGDMLALEFASDEFCQNLKKHGVTPRKSFTFKPKNIPEEYKEDFLAGYFDGNGSVFSCVHNKEYPDYRRYEINISTASEGVVKYIENLFKAHFIGFRKVYRRNCWSIRLRGIADNIKFYKLYTKSKTSKLERKLSKFNEMADYYRCYGHNV